MQSHINNTKQNELKNNAVIFGPPLLQNNNDLKQCFAQILNKLELDNKDILVDNIYQIKKSAVDDSFTQNPIIVKFRDYSIKSTIMQLIKIKDIHTKDIGFSTTRKIIITDQLTQANQKLLNEAKQLRTHNFKYVWYKDGQILVRKTPNSKPIVVKSSQQIETLKTNNVTI